MKIFLILFLAVFLVVPSYAAGDKKTSSKSSSKTARVEKKAKTPIKAKQVKKEAPKKEQVKEKIIIKKEIVYKEPEVVYVRVEPVIKTKTYIEAQIMEGLYKVKVIDMESMPTRTMPGASISAGFTTPINNTLYFRSEGAYIFGYKIDDQTNYSSFMLRAGLEVNPYKAKVIPYVLLGGGYVAIDPPHASVWTAPGWDFNFWS